jgi:hypothetical protein
MNSEVTSHFWTHMFVSAIALNVTLSCHVANRKEAQLALQQFVITPPKANGM